MQKLQDLDLEITYIKTVRSFLSIRGAYSNWLSNQVHWFHRGCPQRSCFGPFLWKVFMNGLIRQLQRRGFIVVTYADDLLIVARSQTRKFRDKYGSQALDIVSVHNCTVHNMIISCTKCEVLDLRHPKYVKNNNFHHKSSYIKK